MRPVPVMHPGMSFPADDKENARLIVSRIVLDALENLKMACPRTTAKRRAELQSIRKLLQKERSKAATGLVSRGGEVGRST